MDLRFRIGCVLAIVLIATPAIAAPKRSFVIDLTAASPDARWRAEAMAVTLAADLADGQLALHGAPVAKGDVALRAAGVELVVRGTIDARVLRYELRALWAGGPPPVRGELPLGAIDRVTLAGALRDRLHRLARVTTDDSAAGVGTIELPSLADVALGLALIAGLLALPYLIGGLRLRGKRAALLGLPALRRTAFAVALLGAVAIVISVLGDGVRNATGIVLGAGGLAWGTFAAVTFPIVFPPLVGLGQVEYDELSRVLRVWIAAAAQRAVVVAAFYVPIAVLAWLGGRVVDLDPTATVALVLPLALLVARAVVRGTIAVIAIALDAALIDGTADGAAWDAAVRGYLIGYLRRNGLPVDDTLLASVRLLPGVRDDVFVYGGGLTDSRIVIPRPLLELALAPAGRPHDYAAPRVSTLHWTQWNAGLVMATEPGAVLATKEQRQPRETTVEGESEREPLGEPPTLAGIIEPTALDPRKSYRPHDDPAWLDWDSGEEYDGTDAGDRDFLFGVLVHALGEIRRHADRPATIAIALHGRTPPTIARVIAPVRRALERAPDALGDVHAAISGARHHLVQYLGWRSWRREDLLTARAYGPELETASRAVLAALAAERAHPTGDARTRGRLTRLGGYVHGVPQPPAVRWRRFALAGVVLAGASVAAFAIADAVRYHPTYVDRTSPPSPETSSHG
jgi:hypothetical protein